MSPTIFSKSLNATREFFLRVLSCFEEEHSGFAPSEEMMTVAQQVHHTAVTVDWFFEGAFRPEGFDLDFESHMAATMKVTSLEAARRELVRAFDEAIALTESKSMEDLMQPMAEGMVMGGEPRVGIFDGIVDHTAHHRGALAVYARLLGMTPPMPYMDAV